MSPPTPCFHSISLTGHWSFMDSGGSITMDALTWLDILMAIKPPNDSPTTIAFVSPPIISKASRYIEAIF